MLSFLSVPSLSILSRFFAQSTRDPREYDISPSDYPGVRTGSGQGHFVPLTPKFQGGNQVPVLGDAQVDQNLNQMSLSSHRNTKWNNPNTRFEFSEENYPLVRRILSKYPRGYKKSAIMPLLDLAQRQNGWLPLAAMDKVAAIVKAEPVEVYEVATFYTMFKRSPVGKFHIQVCTTTPCMVCGSGNIVKAFEKELGIHVGETTKDGMFTLGEVECAGACVNAPVCSIGDLYYEDLTPETATQLVKNLKAGKKITPGPQRPDRKYSEPTKNPTLTEKPPGPIWNPED